MHGDLKSQIQQVKLFLTDVDGVMTDGAFFIGSEAGEIKRFHVQDGLGLHLLQRSGIRVGWISNRASEVTTRRAEELKVDFLSQGRGSKVADAQEILNKTGLTMSNVCYVGDDLVDLALLKQAGLAVAVANGVDEVKAVAHYVTTASGGNGAIREIAEFILKTQNKWAALVEGFSQ